MSDTTFRILLAIESYRSAARIDPERYDLRGPTAKAVDRFLGLPEGRTRQLVQSLRDTNHLVAHPPRRGAAQRLLLTAECRAWLDAGCPRKRGKCG